MRGLSTFFAGLGLMLLAFGITYGFMPVHIVSDLSCGSAFAANNSGFTSTGEDQCSAARSPRLALSVALLVTGGVGLVVALGIAVASRDSATRLQSPYPWSPSGPPQEVTPPTSQQPE